MQLGFLLLVMFASGAAELLSLGAVIPFLVILSDPDTLLQQPFIQDLSGNFGVTKASQLLVPVTVGFASAAVLAALIRLTNVWLNGRLAAAVGSDLSCEAYRRTLYQPYEVHISRNSAEVITGTISQIALTVAGLNALLQIITSFVVSVGLLVGLLIINTQSALAAIVLFGSAYWVLAIISRRELISNGRKIADATRNQLKALQEGLGAFRDVYLDGSQPMYLQIYRQADRPQRRLEAKNVFLSIFPRYAIEALGMVAIALLGGLLVFNQSNDKQVIPLLGALALGAQRLLPALQQAYSGWALLKGYTVAMQDVLAMLEQQVPLTVRVEEPLQLKDSICLENVNFCYSSGQSNILNKINLRIHKGERIGLIGTTGCGKSTLVDLLMETLTPSKGHLLIDGVDIHLPENQRLLMAWRSSIAHVPQSIYLADSSIAENIAFGVRAQDIDFNRVYTAAKQAQIASFIESCHDGYDTFVGERGIRLSGGQRQRIGIARALYKKSSMLVLDEATSALDSLTEESIMSTMDGLAEDLTVIMIAHRMSSIRRCHRIITINDGSVSKVELQKTFFKNNAGQTNNGSKIPFSRATSYINSGIIFR